jgi:hypothetical protein
MSPEIISALGVIVIAITTGFFGMMRYMIKTLAELKPNGGSSMKDQINRLEQRMDDVYHILAERANK